MPTKPISKLMPIKGKSVVHMYLVLLSTYQLEGAKAPIK